MKERERKPLGVKGAVLLGGLLLLAISSAYSLYRSKYGLETSHYSISMPVSSSDSASDPFRIVQLTDLHNSIFGPSNSLLVAQVAKEQPDLILITGDMVNDKTGADTSVAVSLIEDLVELAPVYASYGNQEASLEKTEGIDFHKIYGDAGATVLDREYVDLEVKGHNVRIGGIYGYCQVISSAKETSRMDEVYYLLDFQDTDAYKLLMCHMPVCWVDSNSLQDYDVDCVFSGHAHGGQVRLPLIGGLWAPDQGWFPGRECGVYEAEDPDRPSYLVLSRGLGNTDRIPRFNNVPEIVVVDYN